MRIVPNAMQNARSVIRRGGYHNTNNEWHDRLLRCVRPFSNFRWPGVRYSDQYGRFPHECVCLYSFLSHSHSFSSVVLLRRWVVGLHALHSSYTRGIRFETKCTNLSEANSLNLATLWNGHKIKWKWKKILFKQK